MKTETSPFPQDPSYSERQAPPLEREQLVARLWTLASGATLLELAIALWRWPRAVLATVVVLASGAVFVGALLYLFHRGDREIGVD
jgi:hypothetical protein